jgi:hypothetical protein
MYIGFQLSIVVATPRRHDEILFATVCGGVVSDPTDKHEFSNGASKLKQTQFVLSIPLILN